MAPAAPVISTILSCRRAMVGDGKCSCAVSPHPLAGWSTELPLTARGRPNNDHRAGGARFTSCRNVAGLLLCALPAEYEVGNLKWLVHAILVPDDRQMLFCKLLQRTHIRIQRPCKNLSLRRRCRDVSVVLDKGNVRPSGLNSG